MPTSKQETKAILDYYIKQCHNKKCEQYSKKLPKHCAANFKTCALHSRFVSGVKIGFGIVIECSK